MAPVIFSFQIRCPKCGNFGSTYSSSDFAVLLRGEEIQAYFPCCGYFRFQIKAKKGKG